MGALGAGEHGQHILTLGGILGDYPPTDPAGFDAFAASLPVPISRKQSREPSRWMTRSRFAFPPACGIATSGCASSRTGY